MFAIVDANSFYATCETVFRPDLRGKPVCILSNNDGNVIARSAAAKKYIPMGEPWFKIKQQQYPEKIHFFSSNYALYASMSNRMMTVLESLSARVEVYSIDEAFLDVTGIDFCVDYEAYARDIRQSVLLATGLTVGIGIAGTKTLAKCAQWASKEWPQFGGVVVLGKGNRSRIDKLLTRQPVGELWGVGSRIEKKLKGMGIETAYDLSRANLAMIRRQFNVVLERTVRELNGESCIELEEVPSAKQQIVCSRSFGQRITEYEHIRQAVCQFAERASAKLRGESQYCRQVCTFIKTSPYSPGEVYYGNVASETLVTPTCDTRDIIAAAMKALDRVWIPGHRYAKAGVMLNAFTPSGVSQLSLFDESPPRPNSDKLMRVVDGINQSGLGSIWFAGRGIAPQWQMKREMLSPAYTTRWSDIPVARF